MHVLDRQIVKRTSAPEFTEQNHCRLALVSQRTHEMWVLYAIPFGVAAAVLLINSGAGAVPAFAQPLPSPPPKAEETQDTASASASGVDSTATSTLRRRNVPPSDNDSAKPRDNPTNEPPAEAEPEPEVVVPRGEEEPETFEQWRARRKRVRLSVDVCILGIFAVIIVHLLRVEYDIDPLEGLQKHFPREAEVLRRFFSVFRR